MAKFEVPEGWCVQAYRFTLDPTKDQALALARHFGARRKAYNWTVATLKGDIQAWHANGIATAKPSLRVLRKRWNTVKDEVCVNTETGLAWWPECSKEAYADGIARAVDAYWNWQNSRSGKRDGKPMGLPPVQEERTRPRPRDIHDWSDARRTRASPPHASGHRDRPYAREHAPD
jgi:putative transposase